MWQRHFTKEGGEDEEETGSQVDIDGLDVGDLRQGRVGRRDQGSHGQDGRHTQVDSRHRSATIEPKRNPGDDDNQA